MTVNVDVVRTEFEKPDPPGRAGQREGRRRARADAAHELRGRRRPAAAHARAVPRRPRRAARRWSTSCSTRRSATAPSAGSAGCSSRYFDGDASKLAHLLDPTRLNSPMHQFRQEMTAGFKSLEERLVAIEAAAAARGAERAQSAAKGADFEDLLEAMLGDLARGAGDLLDRTGTEAGALLKSKKGDFVLTLDARVARGCDLRVVIEAKDRPMSMRAIRDELREAKENRGARGRAGRLHAGPRADRGRAVQPGRRRRLLRHRPRRPGAGDARGGGPAGPAAGARLARRARGRGGCRGDRRGADRHPRAARARPHAQGPADVDLDRDQGGLDRARHDALEHPGPRSPRPRRRSAPRSDAEGGEPGRHA